MRTDSVRTAGVDPSQLWLEYRVPEAFDGEIDRPVTTHVPDLPREGALVLHAVHLAPAVPYDTAWVAAVPGATLSLPGASCAAHVVTVDASARTLVVRLQ